MASGIVQELTNIATDQILTVTEPPRLIPQEAGGFQIQCWINQSFDVQCSEDLIAWTTAGTVTNDAGTLIFQDPQQAQHTCRYYRVVVK